jgi:SAM-dependent methyltransferase
MIGKARFGEGDVFFDLGSGLGQVPLLVNLLAGVDAKGIEFEPAYCEHAKRYAEELKLPRVEFIQADARDADYTAGTVFFLYTPFEGGILATVLERLRDEAGWDIRVFTYGPCTATVAEAGWLKPSGGKVAGMYELGMFERVP